MKDTYQRHVDIDTPEHIRLYFQTAGLGRRAAAQLIDGLILGILNLILFLVLIFGTEMFEEGFWLTVEEYIIAIGIVLLFVLNGAYFVVLEHFLRGQTVGKKLMGLRAIQDEGQSMTVLSNILRNFFRLIDLLPNFYFLGAIVIFFHPQDKRIGDLVAGTVVVVESDHERRVKRKRIQKTLHGYAGLLPDLHLDERKKQEINREDWKLLSMYMERLPTLTEDKKRDLSHKIMKRFLQKPGFVHQEEQRSWQRDPQKFLLALYVELKDEWEM